MILVTRKKTLYKSEMSNADNFGIFPFMALSDRFVWYYLLSIKHLPSALSNENPKRCESIFTDNSIQISFFAVNV